MGMHKTFVIAVVLALIPAAAALAEDAALEWDGLQKTKIKGIDEAYVRPGVDLSQYSKVMLDPVQVAFSKEWKPERTGSSLRVTQQDRERIKNRLATLAEQTFAETLVKNNGYPVVTSAAPEVMRITAQLVDVYITAPDVPTTGRSRTYVTNAGRMTLVAELRDSETGALFARVIDKRAARDNTMLQWSSSVENSSEARRIVGQWANILRSRLDAVGVQPQPK